MMRPPMTLRAALAGLLLATPPAALLAQGHPVHAILFYSPTCPHCHKVIQQDLPGIFAGVGGEPVFYQGTAGHVLENRGLSLLLVNTFEPAGHALFDAVADRQHIPVEQRGVPLLLCRDSVLIGDVDIPAIFPRLIQAGLAAGGAAWPAIPELASVFPQGYDPHLAGGPVTATRGGADSAPPAAAAAGRSADSAPRARVDSTGPAAASPSPRRDSVGRGAAPRSAARARADTGQLRAVPPAPSGAPGRAAADSGQARGADSTGVSTARFPPGTLPDVIQSQRGSVLQRTFRADPVGTALALVLLVAMALSLVWVLARPPATGTSGRVAIPVLVVVGVAVAAYLGYVETTGATAVCGPVGDCNAVQQSVYAKLFGVVPVALIGLVGYLAILAAWLAARLARGPVGAWAAVTAFALALAGTSASLVLTVLEPFVIGGVCAWCLTSAAVMTALLWLLAGSGMAAARAVRGRGA